MSCYTRLLVTLENRELENEKMHLTIIEWEARIAAVLDLEGVV